MQCPRCQQQNPPQSNFCLGCGGRVALTCASCGTPLPAGSRFCNKCGTLTLPASLREKYRLGDGDPLTVVDLDGAVLLSPRVLVVPRLAAEMECLRGARKLSLKDLGGPAPEL